MTGTMVRLDLNERQWQKIEGALGERKGTGRPERDSRNFSARAATTGTFTFTFTGEQQFRDRP